MVKLSVDKMVWKAKAHANKGELDAARQLYEQILESFPNNNRAKQGLENLLNMQNPPQEIVNQLVKRYNERSLQEALDQAQALSKTYPNSMTVWNVLGGVLAQLGDFSGAIKAFKEVVQLKPNSFEVYNYIGIMLYKQNNLAEAVDSYKNAIFFNKNYAEAHHNMGVALKDKGDLNEALVSLKKAVSINPNYAEACNNIGIILHKQDKFEEAIKTYNSALSIDPNYTES